MISTTSPHRVLLFIVALSGIILFLRLPGLSDSFCDPDLGTPAYTSRLLLEGRCPYSEAVISKPPGTVALFALVFSLFGYRIFPVYLVAVLWALASALMLYRICNRHIGIMAGLLSAGMYGFYQADLMSSGACPNYETWTILPALGSLALGIDPKSGRFRILCAGALACLGVWMKQTAVFFAMATAVLIVLNAPRSIGGGKSQTVLSRLLWFAAGAVLCCLAFLALMILSSCLGPMAAELNPFKMLRYINAFDSMERWTFCATQMKQFFVSNLFLTIFAGVGTVSGLFAARRHGRNLLLPGALLFLMAAAMSVASGGHCYGHYFVVLLPFMCLLAGFCLHWVSVFPKFVAVPVALLCFGTLVDSRQELKYARMSAKSLLTSGSILSKEIFQENYSEMLPLFIHLEWQQAYKQVGRFLRSNLLEGETIWCFDYTPEIYFYSMTFSPTKHQEHFEIVTHSKDPRYGLWHHEIDGEVLENREQLMNELMKAPPRFIICLASDCRRKPGNYSRDYGGDWPENSYGFPQAHCFPRMEAFDELAAFLAENYRRIDPPLNSTVDVYEFHD